MQTPLRIDRMLTLAPRNWGPSSNRFSVLGAAVNDLIRLQPAKRPDRPVPDHHDAQILFFTGVRYQRMSVDMRSPPQSATRAPRREGEDGGRGGGGDRTHRR